MSFPISGGRMSVKPVNVIIGHYGVGKTNLALNLALDAADAGYNVTLIDLDVVNPYFRSSEYRGLLEQSNVKLVAPVFAEAGTTLDIPSLTGAIIPSIEAAYSTSRGAASDASSATSRRASYKEADKSTDEGYHATNAQSRANPSTDIVIIDAGGDDVGAAALGRFAHSIEAGDHEVFYVTNSMRNLTQDPAAAIEVLREIETNAHLHATALISNAHLKSETDSETIQSGINFTSDVSKQLGLPFVCATVPKPLYSSQNTVLDMPTDVKNLYPVSIYVKTPWE